MSTVRIIVPILAMIAISTVVLNSVERGDAGGTDCVIVVTIAADTVAADDEVTLREAVLFANGAANPQGAETTYVSCADPGTGTADSIQFGPIFDVVSPPTINIGSTIEMTGDEDQILGTGSGTFVDGGSSSFDCLRVRNADGTLISSMVVRHCAVGIHIVASDSMRAEVGAAGAISQADENRVLDNVVGSNVVGIQISGEGASENEVAHNIVGLTANDVSVVDPNGTGIVIMDSPENLIGPADSMPQFEAAGSAFPISNVISGNTGTGIRVEGTGATGNVITDNSIGASFDGGGGGVPNGGTGVDILNADNTRIGGVFGDDTNVISGNAAYGVVICCNESSGTLVQGNLIGLDGDGQMAIPNSAGGVLIEEAVDSVIGGDVPQLRNIISGNDGDGILLVQGATDTLVGNNYIGTNRNGNAAVGNNAGIYIAGATGSLVTDNVISGNDNGGAYVFGEESEGGVFARNLIGVAANGSSPMGNGETGLSFFQTGPHLIGGDDSSDGNTIAYNNSAGIEISPQAPISTRKSINANYIFDNDGLGIDLVAEEMAFADGVTPNDPGDDDFGGNALQNFPVLASAVVSGGGVMVETTLDSAASTAFTLQYYVNQTCDPSGFGEGEVPGEDTYGLVTDGDGLAEATLNVALDADEGDFITATAKDPDGNTSEFSECVEVTEPASTPTPPPGPTATPTPTPGPSVTATPEPTPTGTPGEKGLLGDTDCDLDVDSVDSLWVLREVAGLPFTAKCIAAGDVQCDGDRDSVDALGIQRHVAALPQIAQTEPCRDIGT